MSVIDGVTDEIRAIVMSGDLAPGSRLPELPLAARLGVSRPTVREALRRLEARQLLWSDGRGLQVAELGRSELRSALLTRSSLEGLHAGLVAERVRSGEIAAAQLRHLAALADGVDRSRRTGHRRRAVADNRAFHQAIDDLAGSPVSAGVLDALWDRLIVATERSPLDPGRSGRVDGEHRTVLEAIAAGRPKRALAAAADHVLGTLAAVQPALRA